jgi:hypothetical protein
MPLRNVLSAAILAAVSGAAIADTAYVTDAGDAGDDTYRAAVMAANSNPAIDTIEFDPNLDITVFSEVDYTGDQNLTLIGNGSTITGDCEPANTWDSGLFASHSAADITIQSLSFVDSCNNGVAVFIPEDATGEVAVWLSDVSITGSRFHGLFIDGQDSTGTYNTDDVPQPECMDPHPYDSDAGISLTVEHSHIDGNGNLFPDWTLPTPVCDPEDQEETLYLTGCPPDYDGIRVDDGGYGGVTAFVSETTANGNLADGIEYDEKDDGDVLSWAYDLTVVENGETEAFTVEGCDGDDIEDLDDGKDIDEAGNGDLWAYYEWVTVSDNRDEGLDLDEEGNGSAHVFVYDSITNANEDQGIKVDEAGNGSLEAVVDNTEVHGSLSQNGIEFTEEDNGSLNAEITGSAVKYNDDAAVAGEQSGNGNGQVRVVDSDLSGNGDPSFDLDGIDARVRNSLIDQ